MIAAVQNIRILIRHGNRQPTAAVQALQAELKNFLHAIYASILATLHALGCFGCCMPIESIANRDAIYSENVILAPA